MMMNTVIKKISIKDKYMKIKNNYLCDPKLGKYTLHSKYVLAFFSYVFKVITKFLFVVKKIRELVTILF
jgi:hypothetical protein